MTISVLIITKKSPKYIKDCLEELKKQAKCDEVVIIDSSAGPDVKAVCRQFNPYLNIRYLKEEKMGIASARNRAFKTARGEILAFLDDDCIPHKNWVSEIINFYKKRPETDILLGRCKNYYPKNIYANIQQCYYDRWLMENLKNIVKEQKVNIQSFCDFENIAIRKKFIKSYHCSLDLPFGGWDEDIEMGHRLSGKGKFFYNPRMIAYHKQKTSFWPLVFRNFKTGIADEQLKTEKSIIIKRARRKKIYPDWLMLCKKRSGKFNSFSKRVLFWVSLSIYPVFYQSGRLYYRLINILK